MRCFGIFVCRYRDFVKHPEIKAILLIVGSRNGRYLDKILHPYRASNINKMFQNVTKMAHIGVRARVSEYMLSYSCVL